MKQINNMSLYSVYFIEMYTILTDNKDFKIDVC